MKVGRAGGTRACAVAGVRTLVHGAFEEVVLEGVVGRDARLRVVIKHSHDEICRRTLYSETTAYMDVYVRNERLIPLNFK